MTQSPLRCIALESETHRREAAARMNPTGPVASRPRDHQHPAGSAARPCRRIASRSRAVVNGCNNCRINGFYAQRCSEPGEDVQLSNGQLGTCGSVSPEVQSHVLPKCGLNQCPDIPGADWKTGCLGQVCAILCTTPQDCPPGYLCHERSACWPE